MPQVATWPQKIQMKKREQYSRFAPDKGLKDDGQDLLLLQDSWSDSDCIADQSWRAEDLDFQLCPVIDNAGELAFPRVTA